jgi:hypothetical protein
MFLKNDTIEKKYFNGKIGMVETLSETSIVIRCEDGPITVQKETWENIRYNLNRQTELLEEEVLGSFEQYPLRLAWAVTIHKSQGLTFDKVMIDAAAAFASGQVYVALSRCTSLDGIVLLSKIPNTALMSNQQVVDGQKSLTTKGSLADRFAGARQLFTQQLLEEIFSLQEVEQSLRRLNYQMYQHKEQLNAEGFAWLEQFQQQLQPIKTVSAKFLSLTVELLRTESIVENNPSLQQRISDAAAYFIKQMEFLKTNLQNHELVTEHREASVPVDEQLQALVLSIHTCLYHLNYCESPFSVTGFMRHKIRMITPKITLSCYASKRTVTDADAQHQDLYRLLRSWRDALCEESNMPVYMVASSETLKEICLYLPRTKEQLLQIKGMGKAKVEKWGNEIVDFVTDYCESNQIETGAAELPLPAKKVKKESAAVKKEPSASVTLGLFRQGKDAAAIAAERKLAESTIEGHLLQLVQQGYLEAKEVLPAKRLEQIATIIGSLSNPSLGSVKAALGDGYSFFEVRMGMHLYGKEAVKE